MQLVLEPLTREVGHARIAARGRDRAPGRRARSTSASGFATLHPAQPNDGLRFDGRVLRTIHGPRYRMLVIGASQLSKYLAQIAVGLGYDVTICDPRDEYTETWDVPGVTLVRTMPDDTVHGDASRRALGRGCAHARSETRRPRADGSAQVAGLLRRRDRLAREQREAPRATARIRSVRSGRSHGCTARSGSTSAAAHRRRSRFRSSPRSRRSRTASMRPTFGRSPRRRPRSRSRRPATPSMPPATERTYLDDA